MPIQLKNIEMVNGIAVAIFDNGVRVQAYPGPGGLWYPRANDVTLGTTPPVDPDPTPNRFKWPMNPDAINSRHEGGLNGAYGSSFGGPNTIRPDHNGLDFSWPPEFTAGMPIRAIADGVVRNAYWEPGGGGWAVEIDHDARYSSGYYHAVEGSLQVAQGDTVVQGQHLFNAGESGTATGPHLHLMIVDMNITGSYWTSHVNPETFMATHNPNDLYV